MPITKSAKKALRQAKKRTIHNINVKRNIDFLKKKSLKAIEKKEKEAEKIIRDFSKSIDKAIQKKILKKSTGARMKSRMMKIFNKMLEK